MRALWYYFNILTIWLALALSVTANASQNETKIKKPYFFEINFEGRKSYAFGSMHIGIRLSEVPDFVIQKLKSSQVFFTELKFDEAYLDLTLNHTQEAYLAQIKKRNARFAGAEKSSLTPQEISILTQRFHLPIEIAESLRCPDTLNYILIDGRLSFPKMISLDLSLQKLAFENKLQVVALDSMKLRDEANQLSARTKPVKLDSKEPLYTSCPLRDQLKDPEILKSPQILAEQIRKYRESSIEESEDVGIAYRNAMWLQNPQLINQIVSGGAFIEVGAAHLLGPRGILNVLKSRGASIRLFTSPERD